MSGGGGSSFDPTQDEMIGTGPKRFNDDGTSGQMFMQVSKGTKPPSPEEWNRINNTPPQLPQYTLPAGIPAYQPFAQGGQIAPVQGSGSYIRPNHWINAQNALSQQLNASNLPGLLGNTQGVQQ